MTAPLTLLEQQLLRHEGFRAKCYRCTSGKLSIGIGRNLDDTGITQDEALYLLRNDLRRAEDGLARALDWFDDLDTVRQDVLINMAVNMGLNGLLGFRNTLEHVRRGQYTEAAVHMLDSKWAGQVKGRAQELSNQMRTGKYQHGG